jgi:hypothetical protein
MVVYNSLGQHVKEIQSSEKESVIPVGDLPNGIFTLLVQTNQTLSNTKFVVQH